MALVWEVKAWNDSMVWLGRELKNHLIPLSPTQPGLGRIQGWRVHNVSGQSPSHLPSRPPCFCRQCFVSRAISPILGTPLVEGRAAPVGNVLFWSIPPRSSPWGRQQASRVLCWGRCSGVSSLAKIKVLLGTWRTLSFLHSSSHQGSWLTFLG